MAWTYLEDTHGVDDGGLDSGCGHNVVAGQEVVGHGNQRVLGPALEPVHRAARNQPRELEWARSELLSDLRKIIEKILLGFFFHLSLSEISQFFQ